jgi:hypothetical protein
MLLNRSSERWLGASCSSLTLIPSAAIVWRVLPTTLKSASPESRAERKIASPDRGGADFSR